MAATKYQSIILSDDSGFSVLQRGSGGVQKSDDNGQTFGPLGSGGFGSDTIVQMLNNIPALINALELVLAMPASAPGTEFATWTVRGAAAGVLTDLGVFTFGGNNTTPRFFVGDALSATGFIRVGSTNFQITKGGSVQIDMNNALGISLSNRWQENSAAGTIAANTLTLPANANLAIVPGTPSIQGIVTAGYQAGYSGRIRLAATSVIVNASGAPGAGAVSILTPGAANITVGAQARVFPISYDGINWFVDG